MVGCALVLVVACGDDMAAEDGPGSATDGSDGTVTVSATASGSSAGDDSSSAGEVSTGSDGSTGADADGGTSTSTSDSGSDGSDTNGIGCGDASCDASETCVTPCCGGPPPLCYAASPDGTCEGRDTPVPAEQCQPGGCDAELCCDPAPCVPPAPYCVASDELSCMGNQCNVDRCFGELNDLGGLDCFCA